MNDKKTDGNSMTIKYFVWLWHQKIEMRPLEMELAFVDIVFIR